MKIAYFVHDLHDAAVDRRLQMLRAAGADVTVAGFRRRKEKLAELQGFPVIDLGQTSDARMVQRAFAVLLQWLRGHSVRKAAAGADVLIGRNLEAFALASKGRKAAPGARLVYECLDIHRLLIESSIPARILQRMQKTLLARTDLILTSSPAFVREYFAPRITNLPPVHLIENKVLKLDGLTSDESRPQPGAAPEGPPWVIGWFGMLRCRKTFDILAHLVQQAKGRVQVLIAGRPSPAVFEDFEAMVSAVPGFSYRGPYRADDLPSLYGECHFAWAIDFFEEGMNSEWLLPNRLYEALAHGAVPIGLGRVEIGQWLSEHAVGLIVENAEEAVLHAMMTMTADRFGEQRAGVAAVPATALIADGKDCVELIDAITGPSRVGGQTR